MNWCLVRKSPLRMSFFPILACASKLPDGVVRTGCECRVERLPEGFPHPFTESHEVIQGVVVLEELAEALLIRFVAHIEVQPGCPVDWTGVLSEGISQFLVMPQSEALGGRMLAPETT